MGLINIDNYTIVVDKINYWEIEQYSTTCYLTVYLDNDKSIEIKKDSKEEITKMSEALERKRQKLYEQAKVIEKKNEEIEGYKDIIKEQSEQIKDFTSLLNDISSKILMFAKKWWGEENEQDN